MAIDFSVSYINVGTAAVSGTAVTGIGTTWASTVRPGDIYGTHKGAGVRIASVTDNTHLVLAYAVTGLNQANGPYEIQRTPYDIGYLQAIETLITLIGNGTLPSLAALDGTGGNKLPYFNGANSMTLTAFAAAARSLLALTVAGDKGVYFTDADTAATFDLKSDARALLGQANYAAMRTALGAVAGPAVAVDNDFATYDGTTGKLLRARTPTQALALLSAVASGMQVQEVEATYATWAALTAVIPIDDTIPQNTEGTYILTQAFTPKFADSIIKLDFVCAATLDAVGGVSAYIGISGSPSNALAASRVTIPAANYVMPINVRASHSPGSVSPITFVVGLGPGAGTAYLNGSTTARSFGGSMRAVLRIREIRP